MLVTHLVLGFSFLASDLMKILKIETGHAIKQMTVLVGFSIHLFTSLSF
jgi:hypothetical protein